MTTMINTRKIRAKVDGLSAADGADTYWRLTMLNALHDIEALEAQVSNRDSALEAARIRIAGLTAEREQWAGYNPEQVKALVANRAVQGQTIAMLQQEIDEVWDTLGLADYDGEDSASHFITRLQRIVERHKDCSANLLAVFAEFQATLPPVDAQTEYSAGARYAMITILENLKRKSSPPSGIVESPMYNPPFQTPRCVYPVGRTTCGYSEGNHKHADGLHEFTGRLVFYDPCQTCNPDGAGRCFGHGQTIEEREGVVT